MLLLSILFLLAGYSCSNKNKEIEDKEYFTIKMNETVFLSSSNDEMTITFKNVTDSRCYGKMNEVCFPNLAFIFLSVKCNNINTDITLTISGFLNEFENEHSPQFPKDTLGYRFNLVNLSPSPDYATKINEDDYIAKIKISKLWKK